MDDGERIEKELRAVAAEAQALGPYLEGNLLRNKRARHTKKDGTVSTYATAPVLQYRAGPGKRKSKRIPAERVEAVERLLEAGARRRALLARHRELAATLALDFKKKVTAQVAAPMRAAT
jgi:hypothetical protein